jgi:hypothetical protein
MISKPRCPAMLVPFSLELSAIVACARYCTSNEGINRRVVLDVAVWYDQLSFSARENRQWAVLDGVLQFADVSPGKWSYRTELEWRSMMNQSQEVNRDIIVINTDSMARRAQTNLWQARQFCPARAHPCLRAQCHRRPMMCHTYDDLIQLSDAFIFALFSRSGCRGGNWAPFKR